MIPDLSKLLENRLKVPFKSGLTFWTGGLLAWIHHTGLTSFYKWCIELKPMQISFYIFAILLVMGLGAVLVKRSDLFVLRLLEGYHWPGWLCSWFVRIKESWVYENKTERFNYLTNKSFQDPQSMTRKEREEHAALDTELMHLPDIEYRMPTRLGNILRSAELRPKEKYGLDAFICFPRVWLLLPPDVKEALAKARDELDSTTHIWIWSILFISWGILAIWAIPAGLLLTVLAYRWMLRSAGIYGQLIESVFDVYRPLLYQSLRWPLPGNPSEEHSQGEKLTAYLWRGSDQTVPEFAGSNSTR